MSNQESHTRQDSQDAIARAAGMSGMNTALPEFIAGDRVRVRGGDRILEVRSVTNRAAVARFEDGERETLEIPLGQLERVPKWVRDDRIRAGAVVRLVGTLECMTVESMSDGSAMLVWFDKEKVVKRERYGLDDLVFVPQADIDAARAIDRAFTYHAPRPGTPLGRGLVEATSPQLERYQHLRELAKHVALELVRLSPPSRERSLAITKLEEAIMWANAGIARNEGV